MTINMGESKGRLFLSKGDKFGRLTVVNGIRYKIKGGGKAYLCRCDCGTERKVRMDFLTGGRIDHFQCCRKFHTTVKKILAIYQP